VPELARAQAGVSCREPVRAGHRLLRSLANDKPFPDADGQRVERTLARLILGWLIYMPGKQPVLRQVQAPLKMVYYAITDGCNLRCPYCYASSEKPLPGELSTAQSLDLVDQIADMAPRSWSSPAVSR
jgi:sulfatase maturation enzyme AslB (radical SAM superfamily)